MSSSSQALGPPLQLSPIAVGDSHLVSGSGTAAPPGDPLAPTVSVPIISTDTSTRDAAPAQLAASVVETSVACRSLDLDKRASEQLGFPVGGAQGEELTDPKSAEDAGVPVDVSVSLAAPLAAQVADPTTGTKEISLTAKVSSQTRNTQCPRQSPESNLLCLWLKGSDSTAPVSVPLHYSCLSMMQCSVF